MEAFLKAIDNDVATKKHEDCWKSVRGRHKFQFVITSARPHFSLSWLQLVLRSTQSQISPSLVQSPPQLTPTWPRHLWNSLFLGTHLTLEVVLHLFIIRFLMSLFFVVLVIYYCLGVVITHIYHTYHVSTYSDISIIWLNKWYNFISRTKKKNIFSLCQSLSKFQHGIRVVDHWPHNVHQLRPGHKIRSSFLPLNIWLISWSYAKSYLISIPN